MCDIVWIQGGDVSVITGDRVRHVVDNLQLSILVVVTISVLRKYQSCIYCYCKCPAAAAASGADILQIAALSCSVTDLPFTTP